MFNEPKTLIIVYKDEMLANQMKKLIETNDDDENMVVGTKDNSINVVSWTEKVWLANKKAGNINSKMLFLGNIKDVDKLIPVLDIKYDKYGVCYGWAGNQAAVFATPSEIKSIEDYYQFHKELENLPVPKIIKDAIQPKVVPVKEQKKTETFLRQKQGKENLFAKGKSVVNKIGNTFEDVFTEISEKALIFSEENFRNKKAMERQMLFFGVICLYNDGLEEFMNL